MIESVAIVGAGLAGVTAAQTLRTEGYDGKIYLIGDEAHSAYDRPSLSKEVLAGDIPGPPALVEASWFGDAKIDLLSDTVVERLDGATRRIDLSNGDSLVVDAILLATGANARTLGVPGSTLEGIHLLRTLNDCRRLRGELLPGRSLVVVGGGLIGCEVATTARSAGVDVTIVEAGDELMQRVLDPSTAAWCRASLEGLGVKLHLGAGVTAFEGSESVTSVRCSDGHSLQADLVLVSVGAEPRTGLGKAAGIACDRGYIVDAAGRTQNPGIFAAGDAASWPVVGGGRRSFETYLNSQAQAAIAARAMIGKLEPLPQTALSWTRIAGHHLQMAGDMSGPGRIVLRGEVSTNTFMVFRVHQDRVLACVTANSPKEFAVARRMIEQQSIIDVEALENADLSMRDLLRASQGVEQ